MIGNIRTFFTLFREAGPKNTLRRSNRYVIKRVLPRRFKPWYLQRIYPLPDDFQEFAHPPDPFTTLWVRPRDIQRFSGRTYPPYRGKNARLGVVCDGNWDKDTPKTIDPDYEPRYHLYRSGANSFSESIFFTSLAEHFLNDIPWEKTEWYQYSVEYIEEGKSTTKSITSIDRLNERCREIDELYDTIREEGYRSQKSLGNYPAASKEITVDIARGGDLLFVNGRNRLSIAKILGINKIPVGVYVRHTKWMEYRDAVISAGFNHNHPDLIT